MSYARFGSDGSEVYVFASKDAIECCGCWLQEREWVDDPGSVIGGHLRAVGEIVPHEFTSNAEMIDHLERHRAAGYVVPEDVFERLRDPADAAENEVMWASYRAESKP